MVGKKKSTKSKKAAQEKLVSNLDQEFQKINNETARSHFEHEVDDAELKKRSKAESIARLKLANESAPKAASQSESES